MSVLRQRLVSYLGLESDWERPRPPVSRGDVLLALGVAGYGLMALEFYRSSGGFTGMDDPVWAQWLAVASGSLLLVGRRRWPLVVAGLASAHMFVTGVTMPLVMAQFSMQLVYFFAILSGVAWARDRRSMAIVTGAIVLFMMCWIGWQFVVGSAVDDWLASEEIDPVGWYGQGTGMVGYTFLVNAVFFGGAVVAGAGLWQGARRSATLADQAETIAAQSRELADRAVITERLRIARELHDVVAHHVSAIGVQAGAARRVLHRSALAVPAPATTALSNIEEASREAVTQMRGLLGTLRERTAIGAGTDSTAPEEVRADPSVTNLTDLVQAAAVQGVTVTSHLVEDRPGAIAALEPGLLLSAYRTAQEAVTNVARHSTATKAHVTVRHVDQPVAYLEVEVLDSGRARGGTSGSGLGQLGIRERAATHRGEVEIGPRVTGGYRVRVRFPLARTTP